MTAMLDYISKHIYSDTSVACFFKGFALTDLRLFIGFCCPILHTILIVRLCKPGSRIITFLFLIPRRSRPKIWVLVCFLFVFLSTRLRKEDEIVSRWTRLWSFWDSGWYLIYFPYAMCFTFSPPSCFPLKSAWIPSRERKRTLVRLVGWLASHGHRSGQVGVGGLGDVLRSHSTTHAIFRLRSFRKVSGTSIGGSYVATYIRTSRRVYRSCGVCFIFCRRGNTGFSGGGDLKRRFLNRCITSEARFRLGFLDCYDKSVCPIVQSCKVLFAVGFEHVLILVVGVFYVHATAVTPRHPAQLSGEKLLI